MSRRPRKNAIPPVRENAPALVPPHPTEVAARAICAVCEASVLASDTRPFSIDGGTKYRCTVDCSIPPPASNDAKFEVIEDIKADRDALIESSAAIGGKLKHLISHICSIPFFGRSEGVVGADSTHAIDIVDRLVRLANASREMDTTEVEEPTAELHDQIEDLQGVLEEARATERAAAATSRAALERVRDLEMLLGLDEALAAAAVPGWMQELARGVVESAPAELDGETLTALLVETLMSAFTQRTLTAASTLRDLASTEAGAALLSLEQAVRKVSATLRLVPEDAPTVKKEALDDAWMTVNTTANAARTAVVTERERLAGIETAQALRHDTLLARKKFRVTKDAPEPSKEPA